MVSPKKGWDKGRAASTVDWRVQIVGQHKQKQNKVYIEGRKKGLDHSEMIKNWQDKNGRIFVWGD